MRRLACILVAIVSIVGVSCSAKTPTDTTAEVDPFLPPGCTEIQSGKNKGSADCEGKNLRDMDFTNKNLVRANFRHANLTSAKFIDTNATFADFTFATMVGADITKADFRGSDFSRADLSQVKGEKTFFGKVAMHSTKLVGANLSEANFATANMRGADLSHSNFDTVYFMHAQLEEVDFVTSTLKNASFNNVDLKEADLRNSSLQFATFDHANLKDANLRNSTVESATFDHANLKDANLRNSTVESATFNHSNLEKADLSKATLVRNNFHHARNLNTASFEGITCIGDNPGIGEQCRAASQPSSPTAPAATSKKIQNQTIKVTDLNDPEASIPARDHVVFTQAEINALDVMPVDPDRLNDPRYVGASVRDCNAAAISAAEARESLRCRYEAAAGFQTYGTIFPYLQLDVEPSKQERGHVVGVGLQVHQDDDDQLLNTVYALRFNCVFDEQGRIVGLPIIKFADYVAKVTALA